MKFSELINKNKMDEYEGKFINYVLLKKHLSPAFSQDKEDKFVDLLKAEMSKLNIYVNDKHVELITMKEDVDFNNERECENLKTRLYSFSEFIKTNLIGLKKIFKKHDKITGFTLSKEFGKFLKSKKSEIKNVHFLIMSINNEIGKKSKNEYSQFFQKYLVPQECLVNLKLAIMKQLPEINYVNNVKKIDDSYINSVYLDNSKFELYKDAVKSSSNHFFIRFRWLGTDKNSINCEMINITEEEKEIKSFKISENLIFNFCEGENIWKQIEHINSNENFEIYKIIQKKITEMDLRPSLRTFFRRCIFENKERSININIDTNIVMIKENGIESGSLKEWRRDDIGSEWPFRNVQASEIVRFPYALLTLNSRSDNDWLDNILSNSKMIKNDVFSKFVHGSAILHPSCQLMPTWIAQSDYNMDDSEIIYRNDTNDNDIVQFSGESEIVYDMSSLTNGRDNIVVPVRVEPKAFFANERTFLSWVQFAIFLGGIGTAMVGLGNDHAYVCGAMFIGIAAIFSFYSLYLFHYRASRIRAKDPGPYNTSVGPIVLVGIFILVMILSFIFKFPIKKNGLHSH